jgi:uncharacterized protein YprB with RNaseH-like and TPR domain
MTDAAELRRRLARLGRRPAAQPKPSPALSRAGLPDGAEIETPRGPVYLIESSYAPDHVHGLGRLADLLAFEAGLAAEVARQPRLAQAPLDGLAFLDTETTGLAGGAGTLVFLVGIGTFEGQAFRLRQFFLRDPAEEAGMLHALQDALGAAAGFVTFNGQAFDLPLLEARYVIGLRQRWPLTTFPHLDLLRPSRRLWSRTLPDCTLGTLEQRVLGVRRSEEDVPGALIPELYLDYLRTGETSGMARVIYHNAVDVLSLVGLATQVLQRHREDDPERLNPAEALAIGRWHQSAGRAESAEVAFRAAAGTPESEVRQAALRRLTEHLKRQGRAPEAVVGWEEWHALAPDETVPCLELAKYFEWQVGDLEQAGRWAAEALVCLRRWPADWRRTEAEKAILHRLERLARKRGVPLMFDERDGPAPSARLSA